MLLSLKDLYSLPLSSPLVTCQGLLGVINNTTVHDTENRQIVLIHLEFHNVCANAASALWNLPSTRPPAPICSPDPGETGYTDTRAFFGKMGNGPVGVRTCHHRQVLEVAFLPVLPLLPTTPWRLNFGDQKCFCTMLVPCGLGASQLRGHPVQGKVLLLEGHKQSLFRVYLSSLFIRFPVSTPGNLDK